MVNPVIHIKYEDLSDDEKKVLDPERYKREQAKKAKKQDRRKSAYSFFLGKKRKRVNA